MNKILCVTCKVLKSSCEFSSVTRFKNKLDSSCKECRRAYSRRKTRERLTRDKDHETARHRKSKLKKYGITLQTYEDILRIQGGCAICGAVICSLNPSNNLSIDHDHDTGRVRGILCGLCNTALGSFQSSPILLAAAIAYLSPPIRFSLNTPVAWREKRDIM